MKRVLITGIAGSGGSYLAEYLLKKKVKIFGIFRKKNKKYLYNLEKLKNNKKVSLIDCDLTKYSLLEKKLIKIRPDIIFHIASNADVLESFKNPYKIIQNNNLCTLNLLEIIRKNKIATRIQICSTSEVYGNVKKKLQPIKENCKYNPINPYAVSKTFQDLLSQVYCKVYGLDIVITRMFTYLNARRKNLFASSFVHQIIEIENGERKFLSHGNLNSLRSVLDIRDAMRAYWLCAIRGKQGEIYNISGTYKITIKDFLKKVVNNSSYKIPLKLNKDLIRPKDIDIQIADCKKFKKDTGWTPRYSLDQSINYFKKECYEMFKYKNNI